SLPFHAPPFDQITDRDYQPAMEQGMQEHLAEIQAIANNPDAPTFDNTIVATEKSGALLTRVTKVFFAMSSSNTDPQIQKIEQIESPRLAEHQDAVYLNRKLFARVETLYNSRDKLGLDAVGQHLLERYYENFVRAGAKLDDAQQARLRKLNQEEAKLGTEFHRRLLAATDKAAIVISDRRQLDGLSPDDLAAAAEAARERHLTGKWVLEFQNTTQQPWLSHLKDRALRQRIMAASESRCDGPGPNDTRGIIRKLAAIRAEKGKLLGYATAADWLIGDQMAKTGQTAEKALTDLVTAATTKARHEAADIQKLMGRQKLTPADWEYYTEQIRKARYNVDDAQVKPYFELNHVLKDGVFYAAHQLYGLTFKERHDLPVYQKDVRVFEVFDADSKPLALFYADYYQRPNKSGGAWMDSFVDQDGLTGDLPVVFNVTNFPKPPPGHPT
ncbi:MAG: M3 family metallopeptidase, partial [Candidatus Xenobia bacterium]